MLETHESEVEVKTKCGKVIKSGIAFLAAVHFKLAETNASTFSAHGNFTDLLNASERSCQAASSAMESSL